ncbi:MAG: ATP-binding protein [Ignavibacteriae bacterium]|nr:ATP-binding protein [Ignavibacteriota bacterium]
MTLQENFIGLPFIGREEELVQIHRFFHEVVHGDEVAVMWISGEAGIGKSRLLEQALLQFNEPDAIIISTRFYPDSVTSVTGMLSSALVNNYTVRKLYPREISATSESILSALRHLLQIRPTLLLLEDLHLLDESEAFDLKNLIASLRSTPLCLFASSRTGRNSAYINILPYIKRTLDLGPFNPEETHTLLRHYGISNGHDITTQVHESTYGSPLILSSVIPELMHYLLSIRQGNKNFQKNLQSKVNSMITAVSAELLWHLTPDEIRWTRRLALLGEIFSVEAAEALLPNSTDILTLLKAKGVIVDGVHFIEPLWGTTTADTPLRFCHTFVHQQLLQNIDFADIPVLSLIESEGAFYSITAMKAIAKADWSEASPALTSKVFQWLHSKVLIVSNLSPILAMSFNPLFYAFHDRYAEQWQSEEKLRNNVKVLDMKVCHYDVVEDSENYSIAIEELRRITRNPRNATEAALRAGALGATFNSRYPWKPQLLEIIAEGTRLVEHFPEIRATEEFTHVVFTVATTLRSQPDPSISCWVEQEFTYLLEEIPETDPLYLHLLTLVGSRLLLLFDTPEALSAKQNLAKRIAGSVSRERYWDFFWSYLVMHIMSGDVAKGWEMVQHHLQGHMNPDTMRRNILYRHQIEMMIYLGLTPADIHAAITDILHAVNTSNEVPSSVYNTEETLRNSLVTTLLDKRVITSYPEEFLSLAQEIAPDKGTFNNNDYATTSTDSLLALCIVHHDLDRLAELLNHPFPISLHSLESLATSVVTREALSPTQISELTHLLRTPPVHLHQLWFTQLAIPLIEMYYSNSQEKMPKPLVDASREGVVVALKWAKEQRLAGLMGPLIAIAEKRLSKKQVEEWRREEEQQRKENLLAYSPRKATTEREQNKTILSMLGSITVTIPNELPQKVTGARVKQTLGMIVASEILSKQFSLEEFRLVATEDGTDYENAGNYFRIIVSRLRKLLGKESLITRRAAPPRLNRDVIQVDILDAIEHLENCARAMKVFNIRKAKQELGFALGIVMKGTAFPTLYGDFFESARLDFEGQIKRLTLQVAHTLTNSSDHEGAVDILRQAFNYVRYDEEVFEAFVVSLERVDRHTEAFAIKRHWERMIEL